MKKIVFSYSMVNVSNNSGIYSLIEELEEIDQRILDGDTHQSDENIHRIFAYPAMMVPKTQKKIVEVIIKYLPENARMLDPFMGSATSLLSCMENGLHVYGQDINPLSVLISKVKTGPLDYELFKERLDVLSLEIEKDKSPTVDIFFDKIDKWFEKQVQVDLSKIRRSIILEPDIHVRRFFWVIMAEVIRTCSNDRTSTFKLHRRPDEEIKSRKISTISEFKKLAERSIWDVKKFKEKLLENSLLNDRTYFKHAEVKWGNTMSKIDSLEKFSLLVSSPPYGDNHTTVTYGQHSFLQLHWINRKDISDNDIDLDYLRTTQEIDRESLGGHSCKISESHRQGVLKKTPTLEKLISNISGNELVKYHKVVSFIDDFDKSLDVIINSMEKDAFYVWTIGNRCVNKREIANDLILVDLMQYRGIPLIHQAERVIHNKRMPSRNKTTKTMDKEKILIFHKYI